MSTTSHLFKLFLVAAACACGGPAPTTAPTSPAKAEPAKAEPAKAEPAKADPILSKVCKAFDEVSAEAKGQQAPMLMSRAAVRATELGVSEAELEALGPQPPQLLANIRERGNPPECAGFVAYLEAQPRP